jgi:outer membrane protein assembly factor BamB
MSVRAGILIVLCLVAAAGLFWLLPNSAPPPPGHGTEPHPGPKADPKPEPIAGVLEKRWTFEAHSAVYSTAAIEKDMVVFATDDGRLIALKLTDGTSLWEYKTDASFSASPLLIDGGVFIGDEQGRFHAVHLEDGKPLWRFDEPKDKILSKAATGPDTVLFGSYDHYLYCLERKTGALRWKFETEMQVHGSPCIVGDTAVIAGCDGQARVIGVSDGQQRTSVKLEGNLAAAPAHRDGVVYFGSLSGEYLALRLEDTKVLWRKEEKDGQFFSTAAVTADAAIFSSRSNAIFRVNPASGELAWTFHTKGSVDSSPVICREVVYVGSDDGNLYALGLADGTERWHFAAGSVIRASPAIGGGRLVIGTEDGAVYCFGSAALENR